MLEGLTDHGLSAWPDKVRVVPSGLAMRPPAIDADVQEQVQSALFNERRLQMQYRRRGEKEVRDYVLNPLGLVYRDGVAWLIASVREYDTALQFGLHRMVSAVVLDVPRRVPPRFSLDLWLASHALEFLFQDQLLPLEAVFSKYAVVRLQETPLAADQVLTELADGRWHVRVEVPDTQQLRAWLCSQGAHVEVLGPASLRAELQATATAMMKTYAQLPNGVALAEVGRTTV